jgi:multicomponent Na+:H+ antiporter subunit D
MVTGVLGAAAQSEFRRILSFHIVSQIGYMIMGLGMFTPLALTGSVFYIIHHIIVKTNLFLVSGVVQRLYGTYELKNLSGLYKNYPSVSILFLIPALSLAGIPPLSGFWAKLTLIMAGLEEEQYAIVVTALGVSLLTLFSMTKIWAEAFWKGRPEEKDQEPAQAFGVLSLHSWFLLLLPIVVLALCTVIIGLAAEPFLILAKRAAEQLFNPGGYIQTVLGEGL